MNMNWAERQAESTRLITEHKAKLAEEHGLVGHPKLDTLYDLAWSHGHASGFDEVRSYFEDFAQLLK